MAVSDMPVVYNILGKPVTSSDREPVKEAHVARDEGQMGPRIAYHTACYPPAMSWKLCGIFAWTFFVSMARSGYWASQLSAGNVTVCAVLEDTTLKC
eukprot:s4634_g4.t1